MKKTAWGALLTLFLAAPVFQAAAKGEKKTIRWMIAHNPGNQPVVDLVNKYSKKLEEKSKGTLTIQMVPSPTDQDNLHFMAWRMIQGNTLEMSQLSITFLTQFNRRLAALELPYLFRNYHHAAAFMDSALGRQLLDSVHDGSNKAMRAFAFSFSGGNRVLYGSRKVAGLNDLKGAKIWQSPSDVRKGFLEQLGVKFVGKDSSASRAERQNAFAKGLTDLEEAELNLLAVGRQSSPALKKFGKYVNESNHILFMTMIVVNESFFSTLTKDQQSVLRQVMNEFAAEERKLSVDLEAKNRKELEKDGVKFFTFPGKDQERLREIAAKYRSRKTALIPLADEISKMPDAANYFTQNGNGGR